MRIVCPSCEAAYEVPETALGRRSVRCARCGHEWRPVGPDAAPLPAEPEPQVPDETAPPREEPAALPRDEPATLPRDEPAAPPRGEQAAPGEQLYALRDPGPAPVRGATAELREAMVPPRRESRTASPRPSRPFPPLPAASSRRGSGAAAGWLLTLVVLAALAAAGALYRGQIMAAWPPSIRLYAALGLA